MTLKSQLPQKQRATVEMFIKERNGFNLKKAEDGCVTILFGKSRYDLSIATIEANGEYYARVK